MAVKSKTELLNAIKAKLGEDTSDETLELIEDISDTITDYETKTADSTDWKQKYQENDDNWRKKYRDRFFNTPADEAKDIPDDKLPLNEDKKMTYDELFTDGKEK